NRLERTAFGDHFQNPLLSGEQRLSLLQFSHTLAAFPEFAPVTLQFQSQRLGCGNGILDCLGDVVHRGHLLTLALDTKPALMNGMASRRIPQSAGKRHPSLAPEAAS